MTISIEKHGPLAIIAINRPERRNAVDRATADALTEAFLKFDADHALRVAILTGADGNFCAGADLQAIAAGGGNRMEPPDEETRNDKNGPMGPTRLRLSKPVIAAVEGFAVAGGLELALWCDLRVAAHDATFGVFCRRFGVPLIDGGTVRLPRLIGQSRALDMILTGRAVSASEAHEWGLANRLAAPGAACDEAIKLANELCALPQICMRNDRATALDQWSLCEAAALAVEFSRGVETLESGETLEGAMRFSKGDGRGGKSVTKQKEDR